MCNTLGNRLLHGRRLCLQCYRKNWEQNKLLISDLLPTYDCYTKCLLTSSLDVWNMYLMHSNLKNNMVSVQDDGSKSIFYQQTFYWTKHKQLDFQSGLSAWTYPRRLTGYTGPHCGLPSLSKEFLNIWFGFYNGCIMDNMVKLLVILVRVTNSRSQAVWDKAAFLVHVYFVLFWNLPCENGGMPLDRLALIWWMVALICLIYASRMTL